MKVFLAILTILGLSACHKPLTEPEEIDPIYREYMAEASNTQKSVEENKKKLEEFMPRFDDIVPQTGMTKKVYGEYFNMKNEIARLEQRAQYLELAAKSRKYEARKKYLEAFEAGTEQQWPDPKEFEAYKVNRRVQAVDSDWRKRYPAAQPSKKEAKKEAGEESGGH